MAVRKVNKQRAASNKSKAVAGKKRVTRQKTEAGRVKKAWTQKGYLHSAENKKDKAKIKANTPKKGAVKPRRKRSQTKR